MAILILFFLFFRTAYLQGADKFNVKHFVEKVVFILHESFPKPKRGRKFWELRVQLSLTVVVFCISPTVIKEPPYQITETGFGSFNMVIEVHFRNKAEPKNLKFDYDLMIDLGRPISKLRRERLIFKNPNPDFMKKLFKGGGTVMVCSILLLLYYFAVHQICVSLL